MQDILFETTVGLAYVAFASEYNKNIGINI
jgi:hypothetical protein